MRIDRFTMITSRKIEDILKLEICSEYKVILINHVMNKWIEFDDSSHKTRKEKSNE